MTHRVLRVGLWCAVSSAPQAAEDKASLPDQEAAGRRFASQIGGDVVAVYRVPGHSRDYVFWAEAEEGMPAYRQVREDLEAHRLDVLHTIDVDRLGRDAALIAQFYSLAQRHRCELYNASAPHPIGQQSVGHRYLAAIQGVRASEDQALRVARFRSGMRRRVRDGLIPTMPPLGYEVVRDDNGRSVGYEFNEGIRTVEHMTRLFLAGHSYAEILRRLKSGDWPSPRGKGWYYQTVRYVLFNDAYAGLPRYADVQPDGPTDRYPVLWDGETFAAIVRERQRRKMAPYQHRDGGPLSGVVFCARCGSWMSKARGHKGHKWYLRCNVHARKSKTGQSCHANYIVYQTVLDAVAGKLQQLLDEPGAMDAILDGGATTRDAQRLEADIERAEQAAGKLQEQRERLALAMASGKVDVEMYRRTDDGLLDRLEAERLRVGELQRQRESLPDLQARREALGLLAVEFLEMVDLWEPASVSKALQLGGLRVLVEEGQVVGIEAGV